VFVAEKGKLISNRWWENPCRRRVLYSDASIRYDYWLSLTWERPKKLISGTGWFAGRSGAVETVNTGAATETGVVGYGMLKGFTVGLRITAFGAASGIGEENVWLPLYI